MPKKEPFDRREGPDVLIKVLDWLSITGWILMLISLIMYEFAKPGYDNVYSRFKSAPPLTTIWDRGLLTYIFMLLNISFVISITGIIINFRRHRRKNDEYRLSLIILSFVSFFFVVMYIF